MILGNVPRYSGEDNPEGVKAFLKEVHKFLNELAAKLIYLDLTSTTGSSFISDEVTIGAGSEVIITSKLASVQMKYMVPISLSNANAILTKGPTAWTKQHLSVKNQGTGSVTATILFFR